MEPIRIKCPYCGAILKIKSAVKSPDTLLTCPVCKQQNPMSEFRVVDDKRSDETQINMPRNGSADDFQEPGSLYDETTHREYKLRMGSNLIGRMTYQTAPKATLPIETEDRGMSRAHMYVDVIKGRDGKLHTYACNGENKNPTYVNDELLEADDKIGLKNGDKIRISKTVLRYCEIVFDDKTRI